MTPQQIEGLFPKEFPPGTNPHIGFHQVLITNADVEAMSNIKPAILPIKSVTFHRTVVKVTGTFASLFANLLSRWGVENVSLLELNQFSPEFFAALCAEIPQSTIQNIGVFGNYAKDIIPFQLQGLVIKKDKNSPDQQWSNIVFTNEKALLLPQIKLQQSIIGLQFHSGEINLTGDAAKHLVDAFVSWGVQKIHFINTELSDDFLTCLHDAIPHSNISDVILPPIRTNQQKRFAIIARLIEKNPRETSFSMNGTLLDEGASHIMQAKPTRKISNFSLSNVNICLSNAVGKKFIELLSSWGCSYFHCGGRINDPIFMRDLSRTINIVACPGGKLQEALIFIDEGKQYLQSTAHGAFASLPWNESEATEIREITHFLGQAQCTKVKDMAKGTEIILLMGPTGSGKSTLYNQFFGTRYQYKKHSWQGVQRVPDSGPEQVSVGEKISRSETIIPAVLQYPHQPYSICDCPGTNETRGRLIKLQGISATCMVMNTVKCIKGIIFVLQGAFIQNRGVQLGNVFQSLIDTLNTEEEVDIDEKLKSVIFAFTKMSTPATGKTQILRFFSEKVGQMRKLTHLSKEDGMIFSICKYLEQHPQQIVVTDIIDNEKTMHSLVTAIDQLSILKLEGINIFQQDSESREFMQSIKNITHKFKQCHHYYLKLKERNKNNEERGKKIKISIESEKIFFEKLKNTILLEKKENQRAKQGYEKHLPWASRTLEILEENVKIISDDTPLTAETKELGLVYNSADLAHKAWEVPSIKLVLKRLDEDFAQLIIDEEKCKIAQQDLEEKEQQATEMIARLGEEKNRDQAECAEFKTKMLAELDILQHISTLIQYWKLNGEPERYFVEMVKKWVDEQPQSQYTLSM